MKLLIKLFDKKLFVIFVVALIIRFLGVGYGLPLVLNLDEPSLISTVLKLPATQLDPLRFDWPHLHFYINLVLYSVFYLFRSLIELLGLKSSIQNIVPLIWESPGIFLLLSRSLNSFLGALTVVPLFYFSKKILKAKNLAYLTVILFAMLPGHVFDSQKALLDTAMTFWVACFLFFSIKLKLISSKYKFLWVGVFLGLAFSTKYTAIFYLVYYLILMLDLSGLRLGLGVKKDLDSIKSVAKVLLSKSFIVNNLIFTFGLFITYLLTNFTILLNPKLFWSTSYGRGFLFQFDNVGSKTWLEYPFSLYENLFTQPIQDFGLSLYLVFVAIFILFLLFSYRKKVLVYTFLLPIFFYFYISSKDRSPSHYFIFMYPLMATGVIFFISEISSKLASAVKISKDKLLIILFALVLISPLFKTLNYSLNILNGDTRSKFYSWVVSKNNDIPLYYYGDELELVTFKADIFYKKIKFVDYEFIDNEPKYFYLVLSTSGVNSSELLDFTKDIKEIEGGESDLIKNSTLEKTFLNKNILGPSIYIFKVKNE